MPLDMTDAGSIRYRVKSDGRGHRLQFQLGAPGLQGRGSLYYINTAEAVTLNFTGWRENKASLARFITPAGGGLVRDLGQVVFAQFMIQRPAHNSAALDIQLGDFRIVRDKAKQRKLAALREKRRLAEAERAQAQNNTAAPATAIRLEGVRVVPIGRKTLPQSFPAASPELPNHGLRPQTSP
jgi:hypothetical protein